MKLARLTPRDAIGHTVVHALKTDTGRISKGSIITKDHAAALEAAAITTVTCAVAAPGDLNENEAATRLANSLKSAGITPQTASTGRVNFLAEDIGIVRYDRDILHQINAVDEGITLALVQHNQLLAAGDMVATLKIIPFFVAETSVAAVEAILADARPNALMQFHPLARKQAWLIQSRFDHQSEAQSTALVAATEKVTTTRIEQLGSVMLGSTVVAHDETDIAAAVTAAHDAGAEIILIAGASAIADRGDVIPAAIEQAGGQVDHFGLAVDPGNLLLLGHYGDTKVIGMPGCARSPKLNGLDWVLHLLLAGITLDADELAEMAAGGLLMEIASRPLPRALVARKLKTPRIEGVLLAAGTSSRMGAENKLLADWDGKPMIRHIAETMAGAGLDGISVILGHDAEAVAAALDGVDAKLIFNPHYRQGQSTSLRTAFDHLDQATTDLMVVLGDMPLVDRDVIDTLIAHHRNAENRASRITLPFIDGRRSNPVIWGESFFAEMANITGDTGARPLFEAHPAAINAVPFNRPELLLDADTPEALALMRSKAGIDDHGT